MSGVQIEPRTAIRTLVTISWDGEYGTVHDASAWMEDTSPSGACIRVKTPIAVGVTIRVVWRWGEFAGVTKYCRRDANEYVLGLQRIKDRMAQNGAPRTGSQPQNQGMRGSQLLQPPGVVSYNERTQNTDRTKQAKLDEPTPNFQATPVAHNIVAATVPERAEKIKPVPQDRAAAKQIARRPDPPVTESEPQRPAPVKERTNMAANWLEKTLKREKHETVPNGNSNHHHHSNGSPREADSSYDLPSKTGRPRPQGDLQSVDEVYRSAGIINPRMGYSVTKVVEMMESDYIRGLQQDAKRAAVLMALDAAGVSIDEILRDARLRQNALDMYETDQRKTFEDYWARKNESNELIRQEMEQVTAEYLARIKRATDEMALEKTKLANWQARKKQEVERIAEAIGLCSKQDAREASTNSEPRRELEPAAKLA